MVTLSSVAEILIPFMSSGAITGNIAFFMIIGFYLISNGTNALIVTSNELFHIQHAPFLKRRTKAFFMIILLMALFIFNVLVLAYGNIIVREIISLNVFENISNQLFSIFILFKTKLLFFPYLKLLHTLINLNISLHS